MQFFSLTITSLFFELITYFERSAIASQSLSTCLRELQSHFSNFMCNFIWMSLGELHWLLVSRFFGQMRLQLLLIQTTSFPIFYATLVKVNIVIVTFTTFVNLLDDFWLKDYYNTFLKRKRIKTC